MGLDVSHGCWRGAYSAFHRWRSQLAKLAGIPLPLLEGYYKEPYPDSMEWAQPREGGPLCGDPRGPLLYHWVEDITAVLPLEWWPWRDDPLVALLDHSDCDGEIDAADCEPLARRLEELLPLLAELEDDPGHVGNWVAKTQRFIDGLRAAAAAGEAVDFH